MTPSAAAYKKAVAKRGLAFYKEKMNEIHASRQRSKNSFLTNTTVDGYHKQKSQQPSTDGLPHVQEISDNSLFSNRATRSERSQNQTTQSRAPSKGILKKSTNFETFDESSPDEGFSDELKKVR